MIGAAAVVAIAAGLGLAVWLYWTGERADQRRDLAAELDAERHGGPAA